MAVRLPDEPHQLVLRHRRKLGNRVHAHPSQSLGRGGADPGDRRDRHRSEDVQLGPGGDHDQAVGFAQVAGDLRHQLGGADTDGAGETAGDLVHAVLEPLCHLGDRLQGVVREIGLGQVDEGLVERQRLDEGGEAP